MHGLSELKDQLFRQIAEEILTHRQELLEAPEVDGRALFYTIAWEEELKGYNFGGRPIDANPQELANRTSRGTGIVMTGGMLTGAEVNILLDLGYRALISAMTDIFLRTLSGWNKRVYFVFTPPGVKGPGFPHPQASDPNKRPTVDPCFN